jgi:hypothetical protein
MKTLIQAQTAYIEQVNRCVRPKDRASRVRRSANGKLHAYLERLGITGEQARQICRDAWDMAELEHNSED